MNIAQKIAVTEVCPRDGWQNHSEIIPLESKIGFIKRMIDCGPEAIEVTSFVNPKAVPQMADAAQVVAGVAEYAAARGTRMLALALNKRGVENAREAGVDCITFVVSASEMHNQRNAGKSVEASLEDFARMAEDAGGMNVQLAIPCVFGSPFGDEIPMERVLHMCDQAVKAGVHDFGLADTAGISTPKHTGDVLRYLKKYLDMRQVSLHLHDTHGMGLANVYVALEEGFFRFDSALGGMGGCPFVPGAKGNIATEDLLNMVRRLGLHSGYDLDKALEVALGMAEALHVPLSSSMGALAAIKQPSL